MIMEAGCKIKHKLWIDQSHYKYHWMANGNLIAKGACVKPNYNPHFVPETGITKVYSTIEEQAVRNVNANEEYVSLDFTIVMRWQDPNIKTNFTTDDRVKGGIGLDKNKIKLIWTPDLYIYSLKSFKQQEHRIESLKILTIRDFPKLQNAGNHQKRRGKTTVELKMEVKTAVYCQFFHRYYPVDTQTCRVKIGSSSLGAIFYLYDPNGKFHHVDAYEAVNFNMSITFFDEGHHDDGKNTIGFDIEMDRIINSFIWKYYVPCIATVLVSGLSFIVPASAIPGRVALLVTQFLSLINLFIYQMVGKYGLLKIPIQHYFIIFFLANKY